MKIKKFDENKLNNRPIGFFDSGVGGLTVLEKVKTLLPNEKYIYFGDTKNMPYGEKTEEQLLIFADRIFRFFEKQNVKAVVMACNTTSAVTYEKLKDKYSFKIYPIIQTVAEIIAGMNVGCIGVFATPATVTSRCYSKLIKRKNLDTRVYEIAAKNWAKCVENSKVNTFWCKVYVREKLEEMLKYNPDRIVLGCTHYPYLLPILQKLAPEMIFINPATYFAQAIKIDLTVNNLLTDMTQPQSVDFYVSASPEKFRSAAGVFMNLDNEKITELDLNKNED